MARTPVVDGTGNQFFAGPGCAENQSGGIGISDLLYFKKNVLNDRAVADDRLKIVLKLDFLLQVSSFSFQMVFQLLDFRVGFLQIDCSQFTFGDVTVAGPKT